MANYDSRGYAEDIGIMERRDILGSIGGSEEISFFDSSSGESSDEYGVAYEDLKPSETFEDAEDPEEIKLRLEKIKGDGLKRRKTSWPEFLSERAARKLNTEMKNITALGEVSADFLYEILHKKSLDMETTLFLTEVFSEDLMANTRWHSDAKKARNIVYDGIEKTKRDGISYYYRKP